MQVVVGTALLSVAVSLLLCGRVAGTTEGRSDRGTCDLSIFRTLPPAIMRTFQHVQNHYARTRSLPYSDPLLASFDDLKGLSVPERRVLVRAEFQLFTEVLGNASEGTLGAFGRKVRDTLFFITAKLTECVTENALITDQYSMDLSHLLKRLKDETETDTPSSLVEKVISDLTQLLNEHLTCAAKGASC